MLELKEFMGSPIAWGWELQRLSLLRAVVLVEGSGVALVEGDEMLDVKAGRVLLVGEDSVVSFSGPLHRAIELRFDWVMLEGFLLRYARARGLGLFGRLKVLDMERERLAGLLEELGLLGAELERGVAYERLQLWFSLVMMAMVEGELTAFARVEEVGRSDLRSEFAALLEENYRSVRATRFYARKLAVSSRRLNELCRGWYGRNFFEVLMDRICSEAEGMLLSSDVPVKAVAYELGFSSTQHFRVYFKRFRGISPSGFRERAKGG